MFYRCLFVFLGLYFCISIAALIFRSLKNRKKCTGSGSSTEGKDAAKPVCMLCNGSTFFKLYKVYSRVKAYLEDVLVCQRGIYFDIIERENDITLGTAIGGLITR